MRRLRRLWNLLRRGRLDDDVQQELETHLALIEEEERAGGSSQEDARREARLRFGNPRAHREQAVDGIIARGVEHAAADVRRALRMLHKNPGFTITAVLSLALGIGGNTAMFSVIEAVLVRPLPYAEPSHLVALQQKAAGEKDLTLSEFDIVRDQSRVFASVGAYGDAGQRRLEWAGGEDWIEAVPVSGDFLRTLGTLPWLGRAFDEDEVKPGGPPAIILSDATWRRSFGADSGVLGQAVSLDGAPSTVVGVLPPTFWLPQHVDALTPLRPTGGPVDLGANRSVVARLNSGVSLERAQAAVAALTEQVRQADGAQTDHQGLIVQPLHAAFVGDIRVHLLLLFGATGLLLLLACLNLAMLLMTRFASRGKEIALRVALGSGQRRLFAQFLAENLVLAVLGGAASIAAAYTFVSGLVAWIPFALPVATPIRVDGGVLLFALAMAVSTALILTLVPLSVARRLNVQHALRSTSRTAGQGAVGSRTRNTLVVAEVALCTMLLVGAGLLVHSLYQLAQEQLGFEPHALMTFVTPLDRHPAGPDRLEFMRETAARLQRVPGVQDVAVTNVLPLAGWRNVPTERFGHPDQAVGGMEIRAVSPNYFDVLGVTLAAGRKFTGTDGAGAEPVAMINEALARFWWSGGNAIGDRVLIGAFHEQRFGNDSPRQIVGVVTAAKDRALTQRPAPTVFVPIEQLIGSTSSIAWIVKGEIPSGAAASLRAAVGEIDPGQRILQLRTMDDVVSATTATPRFDALLFGILGAVGIVLAAVGLYGLLSFMVAGRRQEIGTRVALGAARGRVFSIFLRQGIALTAIGLAVGFGCSVLLTRSLAGLLYNVNLDDPVSFIAVGGLFLVVGGAASSLPALRAATVDPVDALRAE